MGKIERYEDLRCWQQARVLVNDIFDLVDILQDEKEFALADQLKRASISVMTNIAEGFNRYHKRDFIRFLDYSQSSAQEVKSLLYIIKDRKMMDASRVNGLQKQCDYCQALTLALLKRIRESINKHSSKTKEPATHYVAEDFTTN
ncbi:four helix bundle protein [Aliifodinibius sp. S!AR15-10]|uniref:four helix bundle protein n=1 Tax=Aliifodinibius sp. S!AR15-10 TaxID=2950437 RepID=UPI002858E93B|nr:four helix bundle protein [Aliifodinibius sp. S!AR15-10]MDR8393451.1 four helix bundle protein [Aliifodinibius sp. S!AR15-10]